MNEPTIDFWFKSDLFVIDPKEDEETNPFCYGRDLANWVKCRFADRGYKPEEVIAEDWGWLVMLQRDPYLLWIGCTNLHHHLYDEVSEEDKASFIPNGSEMTWTCVVLSEFPFFKPIFWKNLVRKVDVTQDIKKVGSELEAILKEEPRIQLIDAP
jgi:hypothetical protein